MLRRFPLEAGVSPLFSEMEDRAAALLRDDIVEQMAEGQRRRILVRDLASAFHRRRALADLTARHHPPRGPAARIQFQSRMTLCDLLGIAEQGYDEDGAARLTSSLGDEARPVGRSSSTILADRWEKRRDSAAAKLSAITNLWTCTALPILESVLLTGKGAKSAILRPS